MKKIISIAACFLISVSFIISCKKDDDKKDTEPTTEVVEKDTGQEPPIIIQKTAAEYYSPTQAAPSSQIQIHGKALSKAAINIGGFESEIDSVSKDGFILYAKVPSELAIGSDYSVTVKYDEVETFEFSSKLKVSSTSSTIEELLISDFDGGGIRKTDKSLGFTNGFFESNPGKNSVMGIDENVNSVTSSPAGGNYAFTTVYGGGILPNTFGFVGTISSKTDFQNDGITPWPKNFFSYPGSVLNIANQDLTKYYINFLVNFNNTEKSQVRIFIGSDELPIADRFAKTIIPGFDYSVEGWQRVSIPLNTFRDGYGFGSNITIEDFIQLNQIEFDISDSYVNRYNSCCTITNGDTKFIDDCCDTAIKDPVEVYIDQVVISYGGEALSVQ